MSVSFKNSFGLRRLMSAHGRETPPGWLTGYSTTLRAAQSISQMSRDAR